MNDPSSLRPAVEGAYAVFAMTNCLSIVHAWLGRLTDSLSIVWDKSSAEAEIFQGKAIDDASLAADVSLIIWSSLPNVSKMSHGELTTVHHFDSKAEV